VRDMVGSFRKGLSVARSELRGILTPVKRRRKRAGPVAARPPRPESLMKPG